MKGFPAIFLTTLLLFGASLARAEDNPIAQGYLEAKGMGTVDMSKTANRIQAKLLAKRSATVDAQRNLLEMVDGVRVTSGTTVKDAQLDSDIVANRVKGLLQGAFTVNESVTEDSGDLLAEVTLGICLTNDADQCKSRPTLSRIIYEMLHKTDPAERFTTDATPDVGEVTGVIVDARQTAFAPCFDARVTDKQGKEVYGPGMFDVSAGGDWLHWSKSASDALQKTDVVGAHPLTVTATSLNGDNVIVADDDAARIFAANARNGNFLGRGNVIFVVQ